MNVRSVIAIALCLNGCSTLPVRATDSYVAPIVTDLDKRAIAADASAHLATVLPPARTTIVVQLAGVGGSAVDPFVSELREAGFGVIEEAAHSRPASGILHGTKLRYILAPLDAGLVLRLQYQRREDARFYGRTADGSLIVASPFTVREAVQ